MIPTPTTSGKWRALALISVAELLGMSLWFTAGAVSGELTSVWGLTTAQAGWLTGAVQLGFVVGTALAAVLNLADLVPDRWLMSASALAAAVANVGLLHFTGADFNGFGGAVATRFAVGFFLAGVYPPAMKMAATWFRERRGLAIGTVVGALVLGKATPYLIKAVGGATVYTVVTRASLGAAVGGLLIALFYRPGPYPFERRPFSWSLVGTVLRHRPTRLATAGYLGHMWELYAVWTWLPVFLLTLPVVEASGRGDLLAFWALAAGAAGSLWGGWYADRTSRARTVAVSLVVSGACCLLVGGVAGIGGPAALVALTVLVGVWGFFVVSDSAQFSAMVTEVAPRHAVGTALTLQTSMGFLLTLVTIQGLPWLAGRVGWGWAFPVLALGPAAALAAVARFRASRPAASERTGYTAQP
jgi:MFS family permease